MGKRRKKRRGHFCWCCEQVLPNERFSGAGHRQHLCKKCKRLGREELAYRQQVRNIDRLIERHGRACLSSTEAIDLSPRDQAALVEALENPPAPSPNLEAAARRYKRGGSEQVPGDGGVPD